MGHPDEDIFPGLGGVRLFGPYHVKEFYTPSCAAGLLSSGAVRGVPRVLIRNQVVRRNCKVAEPRLSQLQSLWLELRVGRHRDDSPAWAFLRNLQGVHQTE